MLLWGIRDVSHVEAGLGDTDLLQGQSAEECGLREFGDTLGDFAYCLTPFYSTELFSCCLESFLFNNSAGDCTFCGRNDQLHQDLHL